MLPSRSSPGRRPSTLQSDGIVGVESAHNRRLQASAGERVSMVVQRLAIAASARHRSGARPAFARKLGSARPPASRISQEDSMPRGQIFDALAATIGETPLVRLRRLGEGLPGRIAVKHEGFNPFASVKDRIGVAMLEDGLASGALRPGMTIVEPTSG